MILEEVAIELPQVGISLVLSSRKSLPSGQATTPRRPIGL